MQPFNYQLQIRDPFESALSGLKLGVAERGVEEQRQQAALEQQAMQQNMERQRQLNSRIDTMLQGGLENATAQDIAAISLLSKPEAAKQALESFKVLDQVKQRDTLQRGGALLSAVKNKQFGFAKQLLTDRSDALTNAGRPQDQAEIANIARHIGLLETNPEAVQLEFSIGLASLGKEGQEVLERILPPPKEGFRMLTAKEVADEGLPPGSYQRGPKGEIKTVVKEPLVKITGPLVGAENKYGEVVGKETAEEDVGAVKSAIKGAGDLTKINRTLNELYSSKAITGLGADTFKNIERVKTLLGSDFAAKKVADTELLDALLGADVFPQIGALGIGAKGLDTPSEREFLRQVMTGTTSMNRNTLIRMTEIRRDVQEEAIKQYNERLERGELDRYFEITKRQKKPISLTKEQERRIQRRREGIDTSQERRAARPGAPTRSPTAAPATPGMKSTDDILRELGVVP